MATEEIVQILMRNECNQEVNKMKNKTAAQSQMPDQLFVGSGLWEGFVI